jgi:DNA polymerase
METDREWLWFPHDGPLPAELVAAINTAEFIAAHNARFDQLIWECVGVDEYGFPLVPLNKWYCTSAACRVNALPASLDDAARALGLIKRKDHRGKALIRKLSIPNKKTGDFNEDPVALKEMGEYCQQDVRVTVEIAGIVRPMAPREHNDWLINERINDRGVKIDLELCQLAQHYAQEEQAEIAQELIEATDYHVEKHTQTARIRDWLVDQLPEGHPALKMMVKHVKGVKKLSVDKAVRADILNAADEQIIDLPDNVYNTLSLIDDGNKSSVAKFKRMEERAEEDHRCRGSFVYAGASQTLRYASRGLQMHNAKRDCFKADETEVLKMIMQCHGTLRDPDSMEPLPVMETMAKLIRPAVIPEDGHVFVVSDWSAIEARGLPYLADSPGAEQKLDIFRRDEDVYIKACEAMGLDDRQLGKVSELSLGYAGGVGAFAAMGRNYGVYLPVHQTKRLVEKWRETNAWAVAFWDQVERAAKNAINHPREVFTAGRLRYVFIKEFLGGTLMCILPDDTVLQYPQARIEVVQKEWGSVRTITAMKASLTMAAEAKEWPRTQLWKGLLVENATQGFCASLLRNAARQVDNVVLHVHDELVCEVPVEIASGKAMELRAIMEDPPAWAEGLPLKAVPTIVSRYGK